MRVDAVVRQFNTDNGTYVNIISGLGGGIGMWGNTYKRPVYLLLAGHNWILTTFDSEAWRDEELPKLIEAWKPERVLVLPSLGDWIAEADDA